MDHDPSTPTTLPRPPQVAARPGVVVVDPDASMRAAVRALLEDFQVTVLAEAADGLGAITAARAAHPAVVVVAMPLADRDALWATSQILTLTPRPRVVLLTSSDPAAVGAEAAAAGVSCVVVRGDSDGLVAAVGGVLGQGPGQ